MDIREESVAQISDIDFGITLNVGNIPMEHIEKQIGTDKPEVLVLLAHEGSFGFRATLCLNLRSTNVGRVANLFYYNSDEKLLELQSTGLIDKSGMVQLEFSHASSYVILIDEGETLEKLTNQITVTPSKKTLYIGGTKGGTVNLATEFPLLLLDAIASEICNNTIAYTSSNPKVAVVSAKGKVKALKVGKTVITTSITVNGVTSSFQTMITVKKAYIELIMSDDSMNKGETYRFMAKGYGVDTSKIIWRTTKNSIVIINKITGKATAKASGIDYVVAKGGNIEVKVKVVVE